MQEAPRIRHEFVDLTDPNTLDIQAPNVTPLYPYIYRVDTLEGPKGAGQEILDPRRVLDLQEQIARAQRKAEGERFNPHGGDMASAYTEIGDHAEAIRNDLIDRHIADSLGVDVATFPDRKATKANALAHKGEPQYAYSEEEQQQLAQLNVLRGRIADQLKRPQAELEHDAADYEAALASKGKAGDDKEVVDDDDEEEDEDGKEVVDDDDEEEDGPVRAEQRRRFRWPLGIGAVGAAFGRVMRSRPVRNIIFGDHLTNSDRQPLSTAGRYTRVTHPAPVATDEEAEAPIDDTEPERQQVHNTQHRTLEPLAERDASAGGDDELVAGQREDDSRATTARSAGLLSNLARRLRERGTADPADVFAPDFDTRARDLTADELRDRRAEALADSRLPAHRGHVVAATHDDTVAFRNGRSVRVRGAQAPVPRAADDKAGSDVQVDARSGAEDDTIEVAFGGGIPVRQTAGAPGNLRGYRMTRPVGGGPEVGLRPSLDDVRTELERRSGGRSRRRR